MPADLRLKVSGAELCCDTTTGSASACRAGSIFLHSIRHSAVASIVWRIIRIGALGQKIIRVTAVSPFKT